MPSTAQRSSVRGFRCNCAASSSLVKNSERIGSLDTAITYTLFCVRRSQCGETHIREIITENREGFSPLLLFVKILRQMATVPTWWLPGA